MHTNIYTLHPYLKVNGKNIKLPPPRIFIPRKRWDELRQLKEKIEQHPELAHISKKKVIAMIEQALRRHMHETERHSILIEGAIPKEQVLKNIEEVFDVMVRKYRQGQVPDAFDLVSFVEAHLQQSRQYIIRERNGDMSIIIRGRKRYIRVFLAPGH